MIKLAIIEDDLIIRNGLVDYLSKEFEICFVSESIEEITKFFKKGKQPDIILLDLILPTVNGNDLIPKLKTLYPQAHIVIYSVMEDNENVFKSLSKGAIAYVSKDHSMVEMVDILKVVYNGGSFMSPSICRKVMSCFQPKKDVLIDLSKREKEVANGILEGLSYKLIAAKYDISIDTVRKHIKNIYSKLHIRSKAEIFSLKDKNSNFFNQF
jgi:DNA-binding NarL/FixJ family response regulator